MQMETTEPTNDLKQNLGDDEELQWVVRAHQGARLADKIPGSLIAGGIIGLVVAGTTWAYTQNRDTAVVGFLVTVVLFVGIAVAGVYTYKVEYAVSDQRLMDYRGRFGRSLASVPIDGIQDAEYDISAIENLFDVGTIYVDTDLGYESMTFPKVPNPEEFTRELVNITQSGSSEKPDATSESSSGSSSES